MENRAATDLFSAHFTPQYDLQSFTEHLGTVVQKITASRFITSGQLSVALDNIEDIGTSRQKAKKFWSNHVTPSKNSYLQRLPHMSLKDAVHQTIESKHGIVNPEITFDHLELYPVGVPAQTVYYGDLQQLYAKLNKRVQRINESENSFLYLLENDMTSNRKDN